MIKMEYSFLKELEPSLGFMFPTSTHPQLTQFPAVDFVNPGLGQVARIHNFMVPLYVRDTLHLIEKQSDDLKEEIPEQSGSGDTQEEDGEDIVKMQKKLEPSELNERKRKQLGSAIQASFQNPKKIKIGQLSLSGSGNCTEANTNHNTIILKVPNDEQEIVTKPKHKFQLY